MKRSTLVAAAVLVVLAATAYWLERDDGSSGHVDRVFDVSEDDIQRVEIQRREGELVIIDREEGEGSFRLVAPVSAAADARAVELVLSNLASMSAVRTVEGREGLDLAEFGLESPSLEVRFVTRAGDELGVRFGNDTLTPSNQYAQRLDSTDVLIVRAHLSLNLDESAWDLRDKRIFPAPAGDAEVEPVRVTITRGGERFELVSESDGWRTATPPRARVDRFEVTGMVSRVRRAEMLELVDGVEPSGLDPPAYRLDVSFSDESVAPLALEVGSKRNVDYYARVPSHDRVFVIEGGLVAELARDVGAYWSTKLLDASASDVIEIDVKSGAGRRALVDGEARELAGALSSTRVEDVVATLPASDAALELTIRTGSSEEQLFFHPAGGAVDVTRAGEDVALRLPADAWSDLEAMLAAEER